MYSFHYLELLYMKLYEYWCAEVYITSRRVGNGTCRRLQFTSRHLWPTLGFSSDFASDDVAKCIILVFSFFWVFFLPQRQVNFVKMPLPPRMHLWEPMCLFPQRRVFFTRWLLLPTTWPLECHTVETSCHAQHVWIPINKSASENQAA